MAENVSACTVWLLYKSIFLLARLSSAITSKLLAWNFEYLLLKHWRKCLENKKKLKVVRTMRDFADRVTNEFRIELELEYLVYSF